MLVTYFLIKRHRQEKELRAKNSNGSSELSPSTCTPARSLNIADLLDDEADNEIALVDDVRGDTHDVSLAYPALQARRYNRNEEEEPEIRGCGLTARLGTCFGRAPPKYELIHDGASGNINAPVQIYLQLTCTGVRVLDKERHQTKLLKFHDIQTVHQSVNEQGSGFIEFKMRSGESHVFHSELVNQIKATMLRFVDQYTYITAVSLQEDSPPPEGYGRGSQGHSRNNSSGSATPATTA